VVIDNDLPAAHAQITRRDELYWLRDLTAKMGPSDNSGDCRSTPADGAERTVSRFALLTGRNPTSPTGRVMALLRVEATTRQVWRMTTINAAFNRHNSIYYFISTSAPGGHEQR
jgi:hypothetical protein